MAQYALVAPTPLMAETPLILRHREPRLWTMRSPPAEPRPRSVLRVTALATKVKTKSKKQGGVGGKQALLSNGSGFGAKTSTKPQVDTRSLLRRSEQLYLRLLAQNLAQGKGSNADWYGSGDHDSQSQPGDEEAVLREYVVCIRAGEQGQAGQAGRRGENEGGSILPDWLPVAELLLCSAGDAADDLPAALPHVCRELAECAALTLGSSFPKHVLEYAYESAESFYDEVVTSALGYGDLGTEPNGVAVHCPYSTLGVDRGAPLSQVRAAYRALAAQHHPDRHSDDEKEDAERRFKSVAEAYERIRGSAGSAIQGSLSGSYAALGGPKRQGLSPPLRVRPSKPDDALPQGIRIAVRPLETELVEVFMARIARRTVNAR